MIKTSADLLKVIKEHITIDEAIFDVELGKDTYGFPQEVTITVGDCQLLIQHEDDNEKPFFFLLTYVSRDVGEFESESLADGIKWAWSKIGVAISEWSTLRSLMVSKE